MEMTRIKIVKDYLSKTLIFDLGYFNKSNGDSVHKLVKNQVKWLKTFDEEGYKHISFLLKIADNFSFTIIPDNFYTFLAFNGVQISYKDFQRKVRKAEENTDVIKLTSDISGLDCGYVFNESEKIGYIIPEPVIERISLKLKIKVEMEEDKTRQECQYVMEKLFEKH